MFHMPLLRVFAPIRDVLVNMVFTNRGVVCFLHVRLVVRSLDTCLVRVLCTRVRGEDLQGVGGNSYYSSNGLEAIS